jgi:hypothetical protein
MNGAVPSACAGWRVAVLLFPETISWGPISVIDNLSRRLNQWEHLFHNLVLVHVWKNVRIMCDRIVHESRERVKAVVSRQVVTLLRWVDIRSQLWGGQRPALSILTSEECRQLVDLVFTRQVRCE